MVKLALMTGIAPSVWADEGWRTIVTALHLLEKGSKADGDDGPRMSG